jgi:hypothetical protein
MRNDFGEGMKLVWLLPLWAASVLSLFGAVPASATAGCGKNVSFAVVVDGQPVAALPNFALRSIGNKQQRYPGLCFSQTPDVRLKNYVVVFSAQQDAFAGLVPSVLKYYDATPNSENSSIDASYGEMWHYVSKQPVPQNVSTLNMMHTDTSTILFVRAYNEQGTIISQLSLKDISGWLHTKEKLLDRVLADIGADRRELNGDSPTTLKTSEPVYYVNCDVPVQYIPREEIPAKAAAPAPPPVATLEFWSNSPGAEIYIDGRLVGKTPSSLTIEPGEYTISMRKQNFSTWQRRLTIAQGKRTIGGYLENKFFTLGLG